jgi:hypothetical protein
MQKSNAKRRKISFKLTFDEWLSVWKDSGKISKRGRLQDQFCMARYGDKGCYELGNVKIISASANAKERKYSAETREKMGSALRGKKRPPRSKEWRKKLSKAKRLYTYTDQHKEAIAAGTRGENNPAAKLTEDDVRAIRLSSIGANQLCTQYGVSSMTIRLIRKRRIWAHVE